MRVVSLVLALSASSAAALNASYVDHRHLADAGLTCSIQNGVDFSGPDIGNVPGQSAQECCTKCNENPQCGAFTWTGWNGGTCWLKSSKGEARSNPAAQSAEVQTAATCSLETNVGYINNDIGSVYGATAEECCGKCQAHTGCNAFTWTNYMGGTCWLKSGKGDTRPEPGSYSSVVNPPGQCSAEDNTNYNGQDIGSVAGSGAADCCAKCSNRPGCGAYTWTNWNGGTCWLKSGKVSTSYSWGSISGKVAVPSTANHIQPRLRSGEIPLRSVNLGGWLVGEYWMSFTSPAWQDANGVGWDGEYLTMQKFGKEKGTRQFEQHRQTWITEADIAQIAAAGMNAVRVPIGFWIMYDDPSIPDTPISSVFAKGALKYLDTLINRWAIKYNLAVMLSLHAHQGSQNGYDHSSPLVKGKQSWDSNQGNIDNSIQFATFIANRYKNSIAFLGMNLMNEPRWPLDYDALINGYYIPAYNRIRATGNNCILVVSPLMGEQEPPYQMNLMRWPQYNNVWHEFHVYYKWGWENDNEWEIINAARGYRSSHLDNWEGNYVYMGEWSLAHPDEAPFNDRNTFKEFAAVQLQQYQGAHSGWAFWSWRHDEETQRLSGWSMRQLLREGIFTVPRVN